MMKRLSVFVFIFAFIMSVTAPIGAAFSHPTVASKSALVIAPDTGDIIYSYNDLERRSPSSLVKLMTALVVLDNVPDLEVEVTVSAQAVADLSGFAVASLREGEILSVEDLLYCLLLPSGADAANALAEYVGGDLTSFVGMMNEYASKLGMNSTNFANPHGGEDEAQYSTAADLAILGTHAIKNQQLADIVDIQYKRIPRTNLYNERHFYSNNALVVSSADRREVEDYYYRYATGLMTGYSPSAGQNIIASSTRDGLTLITVVLGGTPDEVTGLDGHYTDAINLMNWCYETYGLTTVLDNLEPVSEAPIGLSGLTDTITLVAPVEYKAIIPSSIDPSELTREVTVDESIEAPITKGDKLGTVTFSYDDVVYGSSPLVAQSDVERSFLLFVLSRITDFLSSPWVYLSISALVALVIMYAIFMIRHNKKRKRGGKYRG